MVNSIVSYVGEPIRAFCRLAGLGVMKYKGMENCFPPPIPIDEARRTYRAKKLEKLNGNSSRVVDYQWPKGFVSKIEDFIKEMGLDPKLILLDIQHEDDRPCCTASSIKLHGHSRLLISEKIINEINENFTDEHRFLIAHELGHIYYDDNATGTVRKIAVETAGSLAAYVMATAVFHPIGMVATHLVACGVAKFSSWWFSNREDCRQELAADQFAANKSLKLAQGGIDYFKRSQEANQSIIAKHLAKNEERIKNAQGGCDRWVFKIIMPKVYNCLITKEGDNNFDFEHPPFSQRIAAVAAIVSERFSKDDKKDK